MNLKSLAFILSFVFCTIQTSSAQICQEALSLKQEVVSGFSPKKPLPIKKVKAESQRRFAIAYNKGRFFGDERYIHRYMQFGSIIRHYNYRITGWEEGNLIVDIIDDRTGSIKSNQILSVSIIFNSLNFFSISEQSKEMFRRVEQSLPPAQVNFNSKNKKKLKEDKVDRLIFIGRGLRSYPMLNPYKTHIVDFEDQITDHIKFIRQGILSSRTVEGYLSSRTDVDEKLKILDDFKHEAEKRRDNKELTYQYWLLWNMRLSILVSSNRPRWWDWKTHAGTLSRTRASDVFSTGDRINNYAQDTVQFFLEIFPQFIILPAIGVSYKDLNKSFSDDIFLIELQNKDANQDNQRWIPYNLYTHDLNHAVLSTFKRFNIPKMGNSQFSKRYFQIAQTFPNKVREMAEIGFFIFFHETIEVLQHGDDIGEFFQKGVNEDDMLPRLLNRKTDLGSILPENIQSDREVKEYFEQVIAVFRGIYWQIVSDSM